MTYTIYLVSDNGDGHVEELKRWSGEDILEFHLAAYANNAVISIEPNLKEEE